MNTLRTLLLAGFTEDIYPDGTRTIIFPDGVVGSISVINRRRGAEGSLTLAAYERANELKFTLFVSTNVGSELLDVPRPTGKTPNEALPNLLLDNDLLMQVLGFFPNVQAESLGLKGQRPPGDGM